MRIVDRLGEEIKISGVLLAFFHHFLLVFHFVQNWMSQSENAGEKKRHAMVRKSPKPISIKLCDIFGIYLLLLPHEHIFRCGFFLFFYFAIRDKRLVTPLIS